MHGARLEPKTGKILTVSPMMRPHGPVCRRSMAVQCLGHQSVAIDSLIESASSRFVAQFRAPNVQEDEKCVRTLKCKNLRLSRETQRVESVDADLINHVNPAAQQICPGGPNRVVGVKDNSVDEGRP